MAQIIVEGKEYKVTENLGWQASAGMYAKQVQTENGRRMAVKSPGGAWAFHKVFVGPPTRYQGMRGG